MTSGMGKTLIIAGLAIAALGAFLTFGPRLPWLGRLPGDLYLRKDNFSFYFPLTTSILISALVSVLFWLFRR